MRRKREKAAFEKHMVYCTHWKSAMGVLPHLGVLPRPTLPLVAISSLGIPTLIFKFGWGMVISGLPCALDVCSVMLR